MSAVPANEITAGREKPRRRPRGYDVDWRPQRKTRFLLEQVDAVIEEYENYLPLTIRQIFYRLVGEFSYEKTENAYERLAEALGRARRAKLIPFEVIRDDGIVTIRNNYYAGVEEFEDETAIRARKYRRDRQIGQSWYMELWCEAAGMLQQLERVARPFSVAVYSSGGFNSLTGNYEIVRRALSRDGATLILHVGDYDPSGESIFNALSEDVSEFVRADRTVGTQRIFFERVALDEDQIDEHDLDTFVKPSNATWTTAHIEPRSTSKPKSAHSFWPYRRDRTDEVAKHPGRGITTVLLCATDSSGGHYNLLAPVIISVDLPSYARPVVESWNAQPPGNTFQTSPRLRSYPS